MSFQAVQTQPTREAIDAGQACEPRLHGYDFGHGIRWYTAGDLIHAQTLVGSATRCFRTANRSDLPAEQRETARKNGQRRIASALDLGTVRYSTQARDYLGPVPA